jgi:hypothetical protein
LSAKSSLNPAHPHTTILRRTTIVIPAAEADWEVWSCTRRHGCVWQGSAEDPAAASLGKRSVVVALPTRACRTLSFRAPTHDRQLVRKLAYAQLEKRGLAAGSLEQTSFDCHVHSGGPASLVSVDVVTPSSVSFDLEKARGLFAFPRLFNFPTGKLIILEEQGRLVLCAGADGRLVYSQIVSATRDLDGRAAPEIRIATLALQQQGVVREISGIELWGDFSAGDAQSLTFPFKRWLRGVIGSPAILTPRVAAKPSGSSRPSSWRRSKSSSRRAPSSATRL